MLIAFFATLTYSPPKLRFGKRPTEEAPNRNG
jgi:hypothetical protein